MLHITQAAVISTWLFSFVLWCALSFSYGQHLRRSALHAAGTGVPGQRIQGKYSSGVHAGKHAAEKLAAACVACRLTILIVYNAYTARGKVQTWERRMVCISWVMGCYKTMMQRVDGKCAPALFTSRMRMRLPSSGACMLEQRAVQREATGVHGAGAQPLLSPTSPR